MFTFRLCLLLAWLMGSAAEVELSPIPGHRRSFRRLAEDVECTTPIPGCKTCIMSKGKATCLKCSSPFRRPNYESDACIDSGTFVWLIVIVVLVSVFAVLMVMCLLARRGYDLGCPFIWARFHKQPKGSKPKHRIQPPPDQHVQTEVCGPRAVNLLEEGELEAPASTRPSIIPGVQPRASVKRASVPIAQMPPAGHQNGMAAPTAVVFDMSPTHEAPETFAMSPTADEVEEGCVSFDMGSPSSANGGCSMVFDLPSPREGDSNKDKEAALSGISENENESEGEGKEKGENPLE